MKNVNVIINKFAHPFNAKEFTKILSADSINFTGKKVLYVDHDCDAWGYHKMSPETAIRVYKDADPDDPLSPQGFTVTEVDGGFKITTNERC